MKSWNDDSFADMIGEKIIHVTHHEECFRFPSLDGKVFKEEVVSLRSSHEEADCRMFFHLYSLPEENQNVVIHSNDADVLIIALGQAALLKSDVWIEQGLSSDNSLMYVHVNHLIDHFDQRFCEALPGLHALTGSDYTPAFSGRGKVKLMKILQNSVDFQDAFFSLARSKEVTEELVCLIERFVCKLYGNIKTIESVDALRFKKFNTAYKPKKKKAILAVKNVNSISMPPCSTVLYQQILETA